MVILYSQQLALHIVNYGIWIFMNGMKDHMQDANKKFSLDPW